VMTAADKLETVDPGDPASVAFHRLSASEAEQLAVLHEGRLVGFVDRASVMRYLQLGHHLPHQHAQPDGQA
jgi:CBS domain